jgi:hypothetical protein
MSLTTLASVKAFKNIAGTQHDGELARLILAVDTFVALYCRRVFEEGVGIVEYHSARAGQTRLLLDRPPLTSIASIYDDPERAYGASTLVAATDYVIADAGIGLVVFDGVSLQAGIRNMKVTYTGGYATIPLDLAQAAIELVWLAREKGDLSLLGQRAKSIADGNISVLDMNWPAHVTAILDAYRLPHGLSVPC